MECGTVHPVEFSHSVEKFPKKISKTICGLKYGGCGNATKHIIASEDVEAHKKKEGWVKAVCQSCGILNEFKDFELLATEDIEEINVCGTIIEQQKHVKGWKCGYCCNKHFVGEMADVE